MIAFVTLHWFMKETQGLSAGDKKKLYHPNEETEDTPIEN